MKMSAGALNSRVTLLSPSATQDAAGQPIPTWATVTTVWANIKHMSGYEAIRSGIETSTVKVSIRIRKGPSVDASMRASTVDTTYRIVAVLPDEIDRDKIHLVCEAVDG